VHGPSAESRCRTAPAPTSLDGRSVGFADLRLIPFARPPASAIQSAVLLHIWLHANQCRHPACIWVDRLLGRRKRYRYAENPYASCFSSTFSAQPGASSARMEAPAWTASGGTADSRRHGSLTADAQGEPLDRMLSSSGARWAQWVRGQPDLTISPPRCAVDSVARPAGRCVLAELTSRRRFYLHQDQALHTLLGATPRSVGLVHLLSGPRDCWQRSRRRRPARRWGNASSRSAGLRHGMLHPPAWP